MGIAIMENFFFFYTPFYFFLFLLFFLSLTIHFFDFFFFDTPIVSSHQHTTLKSQVFLESYTIIRFYLSIWIYLPDVNNTSLGSGELLLQTDSRFHNQEAYSPETRYYLTPPSCLSHLPLVSTTIDLFPDIKSFLHSRSIIMGTTVINSHWTWASFCTHHIDFNVNNNNNKTPLPLSTSYYEETYSSRQHIIVV